MHRQLQWITLSRKIGSETGVGNDVILPAVNRVFHAPNNERIELHFDVG